MSYTLRGRVESRLAPALFALALAVVLAAVDSAWWPLQVAAVMTGVVDSAASTDSGPSRALLRCPTSSPCRPDSPISTPSWLIFAV